MMASSCTLAQRSGSLDTFRGKVFFSQNDQGEYELRKIFSIGNKESAENPRLVAIALDISLGLLGVHRLYLGTDLKVPIAYTLTLGGGCVLWLVDLGLLIGSKDISKFYDNPRLFMWTRGN